jgi:hypothetical protein
LARLEKDFKTNPPFKAEPEMALLFFSRQEMETPTKKLNIRFPCDRLPPFEGAMTR